ncbi:MAG TPA: DUF2779 domain-containing protein [Candidatus Saccharibacteria bacterium]|nr:DUF2779 domain-containing protein [Candidatus Saccharibacteria bacterium]HRQ06827.1 DUF2779 domain-containing protein [Candidatus Saccharibacteria bacterium]
MNLSKSDFLKYHTCPSYFWLWKNKPELVPEDSPEEVRENKFEQGNQVESLARGLFPNGVLVEGYNTQAASNTERVISEGADVLFQATVITDNNLLAMADVLERDGDGWNLYEVKSSSSVKKDKHIPDMAFQKLAFETAGYKINNTRVIHLNKEFIRSGDAINPQAFFITEDVSGNVEAITPEVRDQVALALEKMIQPDAPTVCPCRSLSRGKHCPTFAYFNPDIPEYSVYDVSRMQGKKLAELVDAEVFSIKDIPDGFSLTPNQQAQVDIEKRGTPHIDKEAIQRSLSELEFPLYFLDYESVNPAIPLVDGVRPHQQMVFQYSLHILDAPDGELRHAEHLSREASLSALEALASQMRADIGDGGSVIAWHKTFERDRNKELGELFSQYKEFYESLNERIYDLEDIFSKNYYVHPGFLGKSSIKYVLPVLVPELSYKELAIGKGDIASVRWYEIATKENDDDAERVFTDLLAYCQLDTLAMVKIYQHLEKLKH